MHPQDLHCRAKPILHPASAPGLLLQYEHSDLSAGRKVHLPMHLALLLLVWCKQSVLLSAEFPSSPTDPRKLDRDSGAKGMTRHAA